jgi:hypothetical protein
MKQARRSMVMVVASLRHERDVAVGHAGEVACRRRLTAWAAAGGFLFRGEREREELAVLALFDPGADPIRDAVDGAGASVLGLPIILTLTIARQRAGVTSFVGHGLALFMSGVRIALCARP